MEQEIKTEKIESEKSHEPKIIFGKYDMSNIEIKDPGVKVAVNLDYKPVLKSQGRETGKFHQGKINIIERFANLLSHGGHRGKKHRVEVGRSTGKYEKNMKIVLESFDILAKTGKNPIQMLVTAIENASPRDEVTVIEYGGARYPQAVDISPLRRINLALRNLVRGAADKSFGKNKKFSQTLAEEIKLAYEMNMESSALKKKNESEKQADSAR